MMGSGRALGRAAPRPPPALQAFPAYSGLARGHHGAAQKGVKAAAAAQQAPVADAAQLEAQAPLQNLHEVADAEQLLEELDACGVSAPSRRSGRPSYPRLAAPHSLHPAMPCRRSAEPELRPRRGTHVGRSHPPPPPAAAAACGLPGLAPQPMPACRLPRLRACRWA